MTLKELNTRIRKAWGEQARKIHQKEQQARPGQSKIQLHEIDFVRIAAQKSRDVNEFLAVI